MTDRPIIIATRGSALALAQTYAVLALCRAAFPKLRFEHKIIKTTGDKLLTASLANPSASLPKGLFTKELEVALTKGQADMAVHSLKDLPTQLPPGLKLGAVTERADVRDVIIYRDAQALPQPAKGGAGEPFRGAKPKLGLKDLPHDWQVATSSVRRKHQLLAVRPDLRVCEIRGNVISRLKKLSERPELDALMLATAGMDRLNFTITPDGHLVGESVPPGLCATRLDAQLMLPCVGQAAIGIEIRENDPRLDEICAKLNHLPTWQAITAERAFMIGMGGGCQSPMAAYAVVAGKNLEMEAMVVLGGQLHRARDKRPATQAAELGQVLAAELIGK